MLKKLLKYDLENVYKVLIIFYGLSIFFALLTRVFFNVENSFIMNIIAQICSGVTISMIINILINNLMRLWHRFKSNLYGDESYLTHTLPVEKSKLYLSKTLASIISLFTSMLVIAITLFIAYYTKENIEILKNILLSVANVLDSSIIVILVLFLFIFFLEFANLLQAGYTGIILGNNMNNNKLGLSVLFGFCTYMFTQTFVVITMFVGGLFNKNIMNLFHTTEVISMDTLKAIIFFAIVVYTTLLFVLYFVNNKLFKKGVNID